MVSPPHGDAPTLGLRLRPRATALSPRRVTLTAQDGCSHARRVSRLGERRQPYLHLHIMSGQSGSAALHAFMHPSSDAASETALQSPPPADAAGAAAATGASVGAAAAAGAGTGGSARDEAPMAAPVVAPCFV